MWVQVSDAQAWNQALQRLPSPPVLQSWAWGEFKSRWGWSAERWVLNDAQSRPRAAVQLLKRTISRLPVSVLYAPKGPVCVDSDAYLETYLEALTFLEERARKHRAVWIKIDGDPAPGRAHSHQSQERSQDSVLNQLRAVLAERGWRCSNSQIQFRNTMHTDVRQTDEALLAAMKQKCRYNIRLAEKHKVQIRILSPIDEADARLLYGMYAETAQRDGFLIRDEAYYTDVWRAMNAVGFVAEHEGQPLAGVVVFCFADRVWYFYGMSRSAGREHMPNHLLQWTALRWARDQGYAVYDWWGAPERLEESDLMWGVYRFKDSFGAQFVEGLGAWDYAPVSLLYDAYLKLGSKLVRSVA